MHLEATKDAKGRLAVGAAVGVTGDYLTRVKYLIRAGVDVLVLDIARAKLSHEHHHKSGQGFQAQTLQSAWREDQTVDHQRHHDVYAQIEQLAADATVN